MNKNLPINETSKYPRNRTFMNIVFELSYVFICHNTRIPSGSLKNELWNYQLKTERVSGKN